MSPHQNTLNEITNKVFNELMQQKTDAQLHNLNVSPNFSSTALQKVQQNHMNQQQKRLSDTEDNGGRSDDWCSEDSSDQIRHQAIKSRLIANKHRKYLITPSSSISISASTASKDTENGKNIADETSICTNGNSSDDVNKKPLIAKWKTGVRLQNTSTSSPDGKGNVSD